MIKSGISFLLMVFAAASMAFVSCNSGTETQSDAKTEMKSDSVNRPLAPGEKIVYQCPMHPEEMSDTLAKCSICGMDLEKVIVKDTVK